jgi:hypothetical protein
MTLFDVEELMEYWVDHPPLHLLLARFLGGGRGRQKPNQAATVQEMLAALGPDFRTGDVHAGLAAAELDIAKLRHRSRAAGI